MGRPGEELWEYEKGLFAAGHTLIAGVDEVGRGPLAGPVVAGAVILPAEFRHPDLKDSKKLSPKKRVSMAELIRQEAVACATCIVSEREIEEINILQATLKAMAGAVEALDPCPTYLLVDAVTVTGAAVPQRPVVRGDSLSASIAAASIVAKVERDGLMARLHDEYPVYNFRKNMGYGTAEHRRAIAEHGPCPAHRRTFRGVTEHLR